eukprot:NODE_2343_length_1607_cov_51.955526_g2013_i0.p1 GENE.NODE_2343_length_1607_cov_51.955526_g2013_i0~~NODE_2343_length_1607_cov_51.955526_g2013_i0.p1  ORF type:complete len:482 (+),score=41.05 NODE_2343_length_1607_cov_51.955526_g2013_i0:57-1502(+)
MNESEQIPILEVQPISEEPQWCWRLLILSILCGLCFGLCLASTSGFAYLAHCNNEEKHYGLILTTSSQVGLAIGSFVTAFIIDRIGQIKVLLVGSLICSIFYLLMTIPQVGVEIAMYCFASFGVGMIVAAWSPYICEMATPNSRSAYASIFQISITASLCIGYVLVSNVILTEGYPDNKNCSSYDKGSDTTKFRFYLMLPTTVLGLLIAGITALLKTPNIWMRKSRGPPSMASYTSYQILNSDRTQNYIIGLLMALVLQVTGINHIIWEIGGHVMQQEDKDKLQLSTKDLSTILLGWNSFCAILGFIFSYYTKLKRRTLMIPCTFMMAVAASIIGFCFLMKHILWSFIGMGIFIFFFEIGPGTLFWVICSEIFPGHSMASGFPIVNSFQMLLSSMVVLVYIVSRDHPEHSYVVLFAHSALGFILFAILCKYMPETRDKNPKNELFLEEQEHSSVIDPLDLEHWRTTLSRNSGSRGSHMDSG